ncbi:UrvD/REP family ATP-dependent DNA helicase [Actinomyces vulturis]|uniref:UrvD/REP family ATP-dependent DNA helicase n=1 Tax=Actinomyces vulturis TaxID=1857645 RepID=UPI00082CE0FA|nr:UrvD/REP family ATP-dependent DNA helicase [Actinomyces vulturis]
MNALTLLPPLPSYQLPEATETQRHVIEVVNQGKHAVIRGGVRTGKTTLALRLHAELSGRGKKVVLLVPTRARAGELRDRASAALEQVGAGSSHGVSVRTPVALSLDILRELTEQEPERFPAVGLMSGAQEEANLEQIIPTISWPGLHPDALTSSVLRRDIRQFIATCGQWGIDADTVRRWGKEMPIEIWQATAEVLEQWDKQACIPSAHGPVLLDTPRVVRRCADYVRHLLGTASALDTQTFPSSLPDVLIIDDAHDCSASVYDLVLALSAPRSDGSSTQIIAIGNPDQTVEGFRGAWPGILQALATHPQLAAKTFALPIFLSGEARIDRIVANQCQRLPVEGSLDARRANEDLMGQFGTQPITRLEIGAENRSADGVDVFITDHIEQEIAHIARMMISEHAEHSTPYSRMAVIARSMTIVNEVRQGLLRRGLPLAPQTPAVLFRHEALSNALIALAGHVLEGRLVQGHEEAVEELLTSPLVGLHTNDLRTISRRIRSQCTEEHKARLYAPAQLLAHVFTDANDRDLLDATIANSRDALSTALIRARSIYDEARALYREDQAQQHDGHRAGRINAEELLWRLWEASGIGEYYRSVIVSNDPSITPDMVIDADHHIDVVTALFKRAEVWTARHPGAPAQSFFFELNEETIPSDSIARIGQRPEGISVLTPAQAAGHHWDVVAVCRLNANVWPNDTLRSTLTRADLIERRALGEGPDNGDWAQWWTHDIHQRRQSIRHDERRMLVVALSRATRRLMVTCSVAQDDAPSTFFWEIADAAGISCRKDNELIITPAIDEFSTRGMVARLRRTLLQSAYDEVADEQQESAREAAALLAYMASQGVDQADPDQWNEPVEVTSTAPIFDNNQFIPLRPSDLEGISQCPLRWFLTRHGADNGASQAQTTGTMIHQIAEDAEKMGLRDEALREHAHELIVDDLDQETWIGRTEKERLERMVEFINEYLNERDQVVERVEVEVPISSTITVPRLNNPQEELTVQIRGRIDRLEHLKGGGVRMVDWKSGKHVPDDLDITSIITRAHEHFDGPASPFDESVLPPLDAEALEQEAETHLKNGKAVKTHVNKGVFNAQLAAYRLAMATNSEPADVASSCLIMLGSDTQKLKVVPASGSIADSPLPESGAWDYIALTEAAYDCLGPTFDARPSGACSYCPVSHLCPVNVKNSGSLS